MIANPTVEPAKDDPKLTGEEVEKKIREIIARLKLSKADEDKISKMRKFLDSDGQGYLLESELTNCLTKAFNKLNSEVPSD